MDRWNFAAGERICYLSRKDAHRVGLLPAAGPHDWWLLDDNRLIVMTFNHDGEWISNELDTDPNATARARAWRNLAVRHSTLGDSQGASA
jgi:hypothetical protein